MDNLSLVSQVSERGSRLGSFLFIFHLKTFILEDTAMEIDKLDEPTSKFQKDLWQLKLLPYHDELTRYAYLQPFEMHPLGLYTTKPFLEMQIYSSRI